MKAIGKAVLILLLVTLGIVLHAAAHVILVKGFGLGYYWPTISLATAAVIIFVIFMAARRLYR